MRDKIDDLVCCQNSACDCTAEFNADLAKYVDHTSIDPLTTGQRDTAPKQGQRFDGSVSLRARYECGLPDAYSERAARG